MKGKIGDKNNYRKHLHMFLRKAHFYNLSKFRLGAWKLNVNNINLKHINRSMCMCNYCTNINNNILEDEEHVIFGCPECNTHVGLNTLSYSIFQNLISFGILEIFALTLVVNVDFYLQLLSFCFT